MKVLTISDVVCGLMYNQYPEERNALLAFKGFTVEGKTAVLKILMTKLESDNSEVRRWATMALGKIEFEEKLVRSALVSTLQNDSSEWVRSRAVIVLTKYELLWSEEEDRLIEVFITALRNDNSSEVRESAAKALCIFNSMHAERVSVLKESILNDREPEVCCQSLESLQVLDAVEYPFILGLLKHEFMTVVYGACEILRNANQINDALISAYIKILCQDSESQGRSVAKALGNIGPEAASAIPALLEHLQSDNENDNYDTTIALVKIGTATAAITPLLIEAIKVSGEDWEVYCEMVKALLVVKFVDESIIQSLCELLQSSVDKKVCKNTLSALSKLCVEDVSSTIPVFLKALEYMPDPAIRMCAAQALGKLGDTTPEVMQALNKALIEDVCGSVSWRAAEALHRLSRIKLALVA